MARLRDQADRRCVRLRLTVRGHALLEQLAPAHRRDLELLPRILPPVAPIAPAAAAGERQ